MGDTRSTTEWTRPQRHFAGKLPQRLLFVVTSHGVLGRDSGEATGFHLYEAARPWRTLRDAGYLIDFASPKGGPAPIDPGSLDLDNADNAALLNDPAAGNALRATEPLERVCASDYAGIYFPGGHGAMWDLAENPHVERLVSDVYGRGGVVAAICHGVAALANIRNSEGRYLVAGHSLAAFTDEEERAVGKQNVVPFLLASKLKERGARHLKAENFQSCVVSDGRLVTAQNPASAPGLADALQGALEDCATADGTRHPEH